MKVPKLATFINNSQKAQDILRKINKNPAVYNATASFLLAAVMRPSLIGCFNFKEKKDKRYSQASAMAAGIVELGSTAAIFLPLNKCIENASKELYKTKGTIFYENAQRLRQYKSVTNRGCKLLTLIPISLLRFSLVKPIVNTMFRKNNEDK